MAKKVIAKKPVAKAKKQTPSQRNITVKDLRDINRHIASVRTGLEGVVVKVEGTTEWLTDQTIDLTKKVEAIEVTMNRIIGLLGLADPTPVAPIDGEVAPAATQE